MDNLLSLLSENSNLSADELAMLLNEPKDYIEKQIAEYEKEGIIKGYHAVIDYDALDDSDATALIELKVTPKRETGFDEIAATIMGFDEVTSVYLMAGSFDLAVFVKGATIQDIAMFVARKLSTLETVVSTSTHFLLKRYKESGINMFDDGSETDKRSMVL